MLSILQPVIFSTVFKFLMLQSLDHMVDFNCIVWRCVKPWLICMRYFLLVLLHITIACHFCVDLVFSTYWSVTQLSKMHSLFFVFFSFCALGRAVEPEDHGSNSQVWMLLLLFIYFSFFLRFKYIVQCTCLIVIYFNLPVSIACWLS